MRTENKDKELIILDGILCHERDLKITKAFVVS